MKFNGIDFSNLTDEQVLFFIRIRGKKSYFNMVYTQTFLDLFHGLIEFRCISEYKKDADVHIDLKRVDRDYLTFDENELFKKVIDVNDVILRCRGLRTIEYNRAIKLINIVFLFFYRYYVSHPSLKMIVSGAVDNYVMDIMNKLGVYFGIKFVGVTDSFMSPQYKLITLRGEPSIFTRPQDKEAEEIYLQIKNTPLSPIAPKKGKAIKNAMYHFASYYYRYLFRYIWGYKINNNLAYEYIFAPKFKMFHSLDQLIATKYLKPASSIKYNDNIKYAYIPLHYYPEATIDYWIEDPYHVNYEASLLDTIEKLKVNNFRVIVKEHPAFYLARTRSFYKKIQNTGSLLISPFISTKDIFEKIHLVVVWNGSTGIEAIVNKKAVVKVTNSYYGDGLIDGLDKAIEMTKPTDKLGLNVVKKVLASSFRTY